MKLWQWVPAYNEQVNNSLVAQTHADHFSLAAAMESLEVKDWDYSFRSGHSCDLNWLRCNITHQAIEQGVDYLWMQDADVYSEVQGGPLAPMLGTMHETGAAAVFALVTMRTVPERANVWPVKPGEVYELEKAGTGMVLIDINRIRKWYETLDAPLFHRTYTDCKCHTQKMGQDIWFCNVLKAHGESIWCDGRVPTTHINAAHRLEYDGQPTSRLITKAG